jgi:hypothetical protein
VAVKVVLPEFVGAPAFLERFKREARAAGQLRHPNIVDVTDFGITTDDPNPVAYLVMEYLDGSTLHDALTEDQPIPVPLAVEILVQICSAVEAAHQKGVVHRDLKPANIWLEANPLGGYRVKVLDFGLARVGQEPDPTSAAFSDESGSGRDDGPALPHNADLTQVGHVLGTPAYMSPEQCRGEPADRRSDIYGIGIIGYQMLSGSVPFRGDADSILRAHQAKQPAPLRRKRKWISTGVARAIESAMQKSPEDRPESALALANLLRSGSETVGSLLRRSIVLYAEYFPEIVKFSVVAHLPVFLMAAIKIGFVLVDGAPGGANNVAVTTGLGLLGGTATFISSSIISGLVALVVVQLTVAPLQKINLSHAFGILRSRWIPFFCTGPLAAVLILLGFVLLMVPGMILFVGFSLWAPVVLLEGLSNWEALRRSFELAARSWKVAATAVLFQLATPLVLAAMFNGLIPSVPVGEASVGARVVSELKPLGSVFVLPLVSIVIALAFVKLRQFGGQGMPAGKAETIGS